MPPIELNIMHSWKESNASVHPEGYYFLTLRQISTAYRSVEGELEVENPQVQFYLLGADKDTEFVAYCSLKQLKTAVEHFESQMDARDLLENG